MAASERAASPVRVGVLGPTLVGREEVRDALAGLGLAVPVEDSVSGYLCNLVSHEPVDVLLVDLEQAGERDLDALGELVEKVATPMVFNEVNSRLGHKAWTRRLAAKLVRAAEPLAEREASAPQQGSVARLAAEPDGGSASLGTRVWVLGASFGGPEAVKRFLMAMPEVPDAAFIIAQHIGEGFVEVMAQQLTRYTRFQVAPAEAGMTVIAGGIYIAPVNQRLRIDAEGRIQLEPETRKLTYAPSIDSVMQEVAQRYGANCGAIIFSGMGDDGSQGCRDVAEAGGMVWAQDSASCAIDSMPACARATGLVRHSASPEALAGDLLHHLQEAQAGSPA